MVFWPAAKRRAPSLCLRLLIWMVAAGPGGDYCHRISRIYLECIIPGDVLAGYLAQGVGGAVIVLDHVRKLRKGSRKKVA